MGNVPHLRFPEFSGEWVTKSINDLAVVIGGGTPDTTVKSYWDGEIQWFTPSEIGKNKYVDSSLRTITEVGLNNSSAKLLPPNTILLSSRATIGECSLSLRECATNQGFQCLVSKKCNVDFLYYLIQTKKKDLIRKSCGSTFLEISANEVRKIQVSVPSDVEQQKIAELLSLIDERIATQNKIIEDLKKLKSAISKQVFAQEPNGWCRLDTLFSKGKAGGTPTSTNKEYYNGEIPFLSINDITKQGKYVRYTENHLSQSGLENSSAWVVPKYSLIMSMYASVGLVTINEIPTTTSQAMFAMQLKDKGLLDYLYYYLSYFKYRYIHKYLETGTQSNINADIIRGIMIPIYGHSRNMEIASTLQGIDVKIDNELSVLKLFNKQKNYLLSQMFI
ncbi:restriction endonuclease subunit S [Bacteroides sp. AM44-19]|jgi:type I restriction enzyme S subunit|uniref:restriction endonuclease subunit S n=1 Tax=Bacteroides sp. AM44-19 TaxID=2292953 RepID=UPI000E71EEC7|nr:restriction endonuclease subunit S [Bacteroides sp. AM44-19]RJU37483.1 restriction endonuclease subunit S [Bacteroides sp. AM44-19]